MDLGLTDSVYYLTGGSRGIGRAIVERLLDEGARVATCSRNGDQLARAYEGVNPDRIKFDVCDVGDPDGLRSAVAGAVSRFGRLDGVIANAGAGTRGDVLEMGLDVLDRQFTIKTHPVLSLISAALPHLRDSPHPSVVVMNGVTARQPDADMAAVSVSRAAVDSLMRLLAGRLANDGIRVNAVNLGAVVTDRQRERFESSGAADFEQWCADEAVRRRIPMGRMGTPEEVAPIVAMLLSPLTGYITGAGIDVAGGLGAAS